uniref:NADH dehydrogenase subunit 6 n=1 Tax=Benedenia seriolae TaxID=160838 RepID=A0A499WAE9_BENSE|nr:NADH dehydrogenase subunit 6 [Benedenia seriolae]BBJ70683.1 NADH dehydrogenase subunit 6 [Benedenia seriolae]BBJ70695.1 NADH dehydrogenase subunit 6 [Benedenia seriolae]BBJ70743.1 NADH dehydrogenase subunit 6 [Benedenia seriolae]
MVFLLFLYSVVLFLFSFISNSIGYCILLIISSLISSFLIFFFSGNFWYSLLLYLIYVGGVYILFLFLSVHIPNMSSYNNLNSFIIFFISFFSFESVYSIFSLSIFNFFDNSFYFCGLSEGLSYSFICSFLIIGFVLVSFISSTKIYFCR